MDFLCTRVGTYNLLPVHLSCSELMLLKIIFLLYEVRIIIIIIIIMFFFLLYDDYIGYYNRYNRL